MRCAACQTDSGRRRAATRSCERNPCPPPRIPPAPPPRSLRLASSRASGARSASPVSRSASSRSTSSTTASCSRIPGTSAGDHLFGGLVPLALLVGRGRGLPAPPRRGARDDRPLSPGSSASSSGPRRCTTRSRSAPRATTSPGSSSILAGLAAPRPRRRHAVEVAAARRPPLVALPATAADSASARSLSRACRPLPGRDRLRRHPCRPRPRPGGRPRRRRTRTVQFTTSDGLLLKGWYVPSRNGAAVISFPGRASSQQRAKLLARHGYGVLALRPPRRGRERGRPQPVRLAGRARHPRCGDVPPGPSRRRSGADRRHRALRRRRDDDRGRRGVRPT